MIEQYTDSYGTIASDIQTLFASKVSLLDRYILFQSGEYEYTGMVYDVARKECTIYTFTRSTSGYSGYYTVTESTGDYEYSITNEYYCYSNDGYGRELDLPVYESMTAWSLTILTCLVCLAVVFKGALFKCLRKR